MSLSEDEDDFQSADEDGFGDNEPSAFIPETSVVPETKRNDKTKIMSEEKCNIKNDDKVTPRVAQKDVFHSKELEKELFQEQDVNSEENGDNVSNSLSEDYEEEAVAERIRERNLKIARKFSAELARSVKASAPVPIPVLHGNKQMVDVDDIEYPTIPDHDNRNSPPIASAPPPTPALSSSFNSDDPAVSPMSSGTTQYGWRVSSRTTKMGASDSLGTDLKSDQARQALDRLSEKMAHSDSNKTLFEKLTEDIKKVSIKTSEPSIIGGQSSASASSTESGIPLISDLSNTIGGWNWSGASRFLATSASQMTSQVGSVLDSVVNKTQQPPTQQGAVTSMNTPIQQELSSYSADKHNSNQRQVDTSKDGHGRKVSMSATEAISNDALVDLTLSAMESLGKKAFSVMTERDESGSLQIKGLGRPWEHLMNMKKGPEPQQQEFNASELSSTGHDFDDIPSTSTRHESSSKVINENTNLKIRKRRNNYTDDDKLD